MVRAEQDRMAISLGRGQAQGAVAALLIHGDASFSGLGIVAECLQLSNVPGPFFHQLVDGRELVQECKPSSRCPLLGF